MSEEEYVMLFVDILILYVNMELSYNCLKYWDVNSFYGWAVSQKLSVNDFKWVEETSQFNEDFIKSYNAS